MFRLSGSRNERTQPPATGRHFQGAWSIVPQSVPDFLQEHLPANRYEDLERASRGWTIPLFTLDPETKRVECALHPEVDDAESPVLDAVCMACDLLSETDVALEWGDGMLDTWDTSGEMPLVYRFDLDESEIYRRFRRLLEENLVGDAGIDAEFQKYPWGYRAHITIRYQSDFDYQRKKDAIEWMLQVARNKAADSPFLGRKM